MIYLNARCAVLVYLLLDQWTQAPNKQSSSKSILKWLLQPPMFRLWLKNHAPLPTYPYGKSQYKPYLVGGLHPFEKILVKLDHFSFGFSLSLSTVGVKVEKLVYKKLWEFRWWVKNLFDYSIQYSRQRSETIKTCETTIQGRFCRCCVLPRRSLRFHLNLWGPAALASKGFQQLAKLMPSDRHVSLVHISDHCETTTGSTGQLISQYAKWWKSQPFCMQS